MKRYIPAFLTAFWLLVFAAIILPQEIQVSTPEDYPRVILQTTPVDPTDLLRGDFVVLQYDFTRQVWREEENLFSKELKDFLNKTPSGKTAFVSLKINKDGRGSPLHISLEKPISGLFIMGTIRGSNSWRNNKQFRAGIEKFFVPRGKGYLLEEAVRKESFEIEVAIDPESGKTLIVQPLIEGHPVDFSAIEARK